jgi:biotin transporter BioY
MNAAKVGVLIGGFYVAFLCACWLAGKLRARMKRIEADREKTHRDFFGEGGA